jgi:oligopeptide/dipeptide ABC transporter ATP-binding protein
MSFLSVHHLAVSYRTSSGRRRVLDEVTFALEEGDTLGIVGESGSGKSTLVSAILGMLPPGGAIDDGEIWFEGRDLVTLDAEALRQVRGRRIAMIPQDAAVALNPVFTIRNQLFESIPRSEKDPEASARALLADVRVPTPERRLDSYPHMLSGGLKQRVIGAMAMAAGARLVIGDEPTTALDVTVQAEYLRLINELRRRQGFALLFISHDLGVVASTCRRVAVMYGGRIVEQGPTDQLLSEPRHPYTRALLRARPTVDQRVEWLEGIPGDPPDLLRGTAGCSFAPRCPLVRETCLHVVPPVTAIDDAHEARCHALLEGDMR